MMNTACPGAALCALRAEDAWPVASMLAGMSPWLDLGYSAMQLEHYLSAHDPSLHRYTVMVDALIAGVVAVRYPWLRGSYLELIGLCPDQQDVAWARPFCTGWNGKPKHWR